MRSTSQRSVLRFASENGGHRKKLLLVGSWLLLWRGQKKTAGSDFAIYRPEGPEVSNNGKKLAVSFGRFRQRASFKFCCRQKLIAINALQNLNQNVHSSYFNGLCNPRFKSKSVYRS